MAKRWASGVLVGMGLAGLLPTSATAQGVAEPMPMQLPGGPSAWNPYAGQMPPGAMPGGPPMGMPGMGMPGMMPPGMGMPPGMPPGGFDPNMMGGPGMPMMNPASCGPNGMPGVDLQMGATYYPGISGEGGGILGCLKNCFYSESGERRALYGKVGYVGLMRNSLNGRPLVAIEPQFQIDPDSEFGFRPTTDGDPVLLSPFILNMSGLSPRLHNGVQFALGIQDKDDNWVFEIGGYYAAFAAKRRDFFATGQLDTPYINAPVGFQDTAGLWLNADFMRFTLGNSVYSAEMNMKWFGSTWKCLDVNYLVGLRYIRLYERFTHYTIDDDFQFGVDDPTTRATVDFKAENDMVGGQVGFGLTQWLTEAWSVSYDQKVAFLANGAKTRNRLVRDDGLVGYDSTHTTWRFATAYEGGLYLGLGAGSWRIRAGYEYKIFVGVASVDQQFTYDLGEAAFRHKSTDTIIYHGPSATIEWVF